MLPNALSPPAPSRQPGAVLLLALVFLLLLALLSGTVMQGSALQFRMAGNDQFREEWLQLAQGIATAIAQEPDNFPLDLPVGHTVCPSGCDRARPGMLDALDPAMLPPAPARVGYRVERRWPRLRAGLPVRPVEADASSVLAYQSATFEVHAQVDGSAAGWGRAEAVRGIAILVARPHGTKRS